MADKKSNIVSESYPMIGGDSPHSYALNSSYQKGAVDAAKEMINEAVQLMLDFKKAPFNCINTFQIVDFGCSIGPNTFISVENIIEAVDLKYHAQLQEKSPLQFQVFFNDHTNNDFNTLFKTLPPSRKYLAAGVPGTFYSPLFPKSTIHFGHSSYALQWLSKVPEEVMDGKSPAWNQGSIYCTGLAKEVANAYSAQFKNDIESFLSARARELVDGGLMVIIIPALPDGVLFSETFSGMAFDLLRSCLMDMAKLGLISEEKVEAFNLPMYFPPIKELEALIHRNGYFDIERIDTIANPMNHMTRTAEFTTLLVRAITQEIIKKHFGNDIVDTVYESLSKKLSEHFSISNVENRKFVELFILLKRTTN